MKITKAVRFTLIFAGVGLVTTFLIIYVQRNTITTYSRNLPLLTLGDNIKNRTTKAHLWLEELMEGDKTLNFDADVLSLFISSQQLLESAYDGKSTELGTFEK